MKLELVRWDFCTQFLFVLVLEQLKVFNNAICKASLGLIREIQGPGCTNPVSIISVTWNWWFHSLNPGPSVHKSTEASIFIMVMKP